MSDFDKGTIIVLLAVSLAVWVVPGVVYFYRKWKMRNMDDPGRKLGVSRMLIFSICLLASVWSLRYAVGYFSVLFPAKDVEPLFWWEEVLNSLVHSLQTFSMDEDYTEYIRTGKEMMAMAVGEWTGWQVLYGIYASILNVAAPIAGGAIVLEVLARIFPEIQLRLSFWNVRRKKYYFSELNAASLALAKSISREKHREHPVLVFTDTYIDDEQEKEYELLLEAKRYGAICVRKDLAHVPKPLRSKREFYLMDEKEFGNLQTLLGLMEERNIPYIADSNIYLFVLTDAYVQIEKQAKHLLDAKKALLRGGKKPIIVPVRGYRNLVQNLMNDVPLYEPLVNTPEADGLKVTILGNGIIGTEAFLNTYWMGQMMIHQGEGAGETMAPCAVDISVVSKETKETFWARMDYVNTEIRKTIAEQSEGKLLQVYPEGTEYNVPYCRVQYSEQDVKTSSFWMDAEEGKKHLLDADYYIVALGNDSDNIAIAEKLRCFVAKRHVEEYTGKPPRKVVIAYAVFDSEMTAALNREKHFCSVNPQEPDIYMHAFGNLDQVYSCDNVYISKTSLWEKETGTQASHWEQTHQRDNINRISGEDYENANYNYWATLARAMHMKYKLFSLGWITTSVFGCLTEAECEEKHRSKVRALLRRYRNCAVAGDQHSRLTEEDRLAYQQLQKKRECLAWLEHRRWNAFTRIMGYQSIDVSKMIQKELGRKDHKDMRIKLHACLVEARRPLLENGDSYLTTGEMAPDLLDVVTQAKRTLKENATDLKVYDYYEREFSNFRFEQDLLDALKAGKVKSPEKYCDYRQFRDAFPCEMAAGTAWLVPLDEVQSLVAKDYAKTTKEDPCQEKFSLGGKYYKPKTAE